MAKACEICGKSYQKGYSISHAHNKTRKIWKPNLQRVKSIIKGNIKHIYACSRCIRSGFVKKAA